MGANINAFKAARDTRIFENRDYELRRGEACWTDKRDVTHWAVGDVMVSQHPRETMLVWTACGKHDVPANGAFYHEQDVTVDCPLCLDMEK